MLQALIAGFLLGITQIAAIGMQNALILNHAIRGKPILRLCIACSLCDIVMISFGVFGIGTLMFTSPDHIKLFQKLGGIFLLFYGAKLLNNALTKNQSRNINQEYKSNNIIWAILVVSIINPQSWLDCIVVIGSMSTKYKGQVKISFTLGCILASIIWFTFLGYSSKKISYIFQKPITWKILDFTMAFLMWGLSYNLLI